MPILRRRSMLYHITTLISIANNVASLLKTQSEALKEEAEQKTQNLKTMFKADVKESVLKAEARHIVLLKKRAELLDRLAEDLTRSSAKLTEIVDKLEEVLCEMMNITRTLIHEDIINDLLPVLNDLVNELTIVVTKFLGLSKKGVLNYLKMSDEEVLEDILKDLKGLNHHQSPLFPA